MPRPRSSSGTKTSWISCVPSLVDSQKMCACLSAEQGLYISKRCDEELGVAGECERIEWLVVSPKSCKLSQAHRPDLEVTAFCSWRKVEHRTLPSSPIKLPYILSSHQLKMLSNIFFSSLMMQIF